MKETSGHWFDPFPCRSAIFRSQDNAEIVLPIALHRMDKPRRGADLGGEQAAVHGLGDDGCIVRQEVEWRGTEQILQRCRIDPVAVEKRGLVLVQQYPDGAGPALQAAD